FARTIRQRWNEWARLSIRDLDAQLEALRKETQKLLDLRAEAQRKGEPSSPAEQARLKEVNAQRDLGTFERALRLYELAYVDRGQPKKPESMARSAVAASAMGLMTSPAGSVPLLAA